MKNVFIIIRRFLPHYKKEIFLNVLFNFLSAIFGIFSFISMIPALRILFGVSEKVTGYLPIEIKGKSIKEIGTILQHNAYAYISEITEKQGPTYALIVISLFLIFMVFLKVLSAYLSTFYMVHVRNGVVRDLRNKIYEKAIQLPLSFYSEERKGDIISRMMSDVMEIENSVVNAFDMIFKNPIIIIVSLTTMILMSWQLTIFVLIMFPGAGFLIGRIGRSLKKKSLEGQNKIGELMAIIEETLSGLRIIQAFNAEHRVTNKFKKETESYKKIMNRIMKRYFLAHPVSELLGTILIVIVLWFGGNLIFNNVSNLKAEEFIVYLVVFYSIINPVKSFSQAIYSVQKGMASLERIDKLLNAPISIKEKPNALPIKDFRESIVYKNVYFKYNNEYVLKNINITIKKGMTVAIVGKSGSGKSTLVDLLPRFYDVTEGEILIDNINIKHYKLIDLRNLFGIVNQDPILFNDTIFNNIAFGIENATEEDIINAAKMANAHDFIITFPDKYHTIIGDRGSKLSGGQRQRISIARALLKNPSILILDEATSALDTESEKLVQEAINRLMKNRTSIIIAHRLSTIIHADMIYVLKEGEIVESGNHYDLLKLNGEYKKFYEMQFFV